MVLRDDKGKVVFAAYRVLFHCNDALEAELHAIMEGMKLAKEHTSLPVMVQSDSSTALLSLSSGALDCSSYAHIVSEIQGLMVAREFIPSKIPRLKNRVADRLANHGRLECSIA